MAYMSKRAIPAPYVTKTADKETANVGDKLTYTVKVGNGDGAVYEIENAKMADTIPAEFDFVDGSVQVDGKSYPYSYDNTSRQAVCADRQFETERSTHRNFLRDREQVGLRQDRTQHCCPLRR